MAYLLATNGMDEGRHYPLAQGRVLIGRAADCQVLLDAESVSRHHASVHCHGPRFTLEDHDSRNGTYLNSLRVRQRTVLSDGDKLRIGDPEFAVQLTSQTPPLPVQPEHESAGELWRAATCPATLQARAQLWKKTRRFFDERGFIEVDTPLLSADTVVDRWIEPVPVTVGGRRMWLQTSPEFAMKRLLASGAASIYQLTHAFRDEEEGQRHNPEFSMLEWYRLGDSMSDAMDLLDELSQALLGVEPARKVSYREAFQQQLGLDPHSGSTSELLSLIAKLDFQPPENWRAMDRDDWLNLLLLEFVEPSLADQPTILYDYPASQAALAQIRQDETPVAERFELYVNGVELANGYHELLDPDELLARNRKVNEQRRADGRIELPEESHLIAAMRHGLGDCAGVAVGMDRVLMIAESLPDISNALPFPFPRA